MRAVFQTQPEVGHVYLGSKRHVLEAIFSDRNEPFWRSAQRMELGRISTEAFASYLHDRFATSERDADAIRIGADADFVIWDPRGETIISADHLHGNADWSPYDGMKLAGSWIIRYFEAKSW